MVRAAWVKPMTLVQKFEANETVAANTQCFLIGCESNASSSQGPGSPEFGWNKEEGSYTSYDIFGEVYWGKPDGFAHGTCHTASNNVFSIDGGNIKFIEETNGANNIVGLDSWTDVDNNNVVSVGDVVYWYTSDIGRSVVRAGWRWNHWGHVEAVDPVHPNRS